MPNWVFNYVDVSGKREDLLAFAEKARKPHTTQWLSDQWITGADGKRVKVEDDQRKIEVKEETPNALSFWNFVSPTDEELPYYFGHKIKPEDEDDPDASMNERLAKAMTFSGSGWYDWNVRNWGTKWDACDDDLLTSLDELKAHDTIIYQFNTAWGIPVEVFRAMVKQHPELDFDFESEEEQGWGAKFTSSDGERSGEEQRSLIETESWEIPNSHADYVARDRADSCSCSHNEDEDDWYKDCPRPEKDFIVVIQRTYTIKSKDAGTAWEKANDLEPDELPEYEQHSEKSVFVQDEDGNKIYPNLSNFDLTSD